MASQIIVVLLAATMMTPGLAAILNRPLDRLRTIEKRYRWIFASAVFLCSAGYFRECAVIAGRPLIPLYHDEFMYLLQAQMLAKGRLWMHAHTLAEFFDSFFIVTHPVYAATYFPGTALLNVPGIWLHLAPWITALLIASLVVMMLYLVVAELIDGTAGLLAVCVALSLPRLRAFSVSTMSHVVMLLMLLTAAWCFSRWRQNKSIRWAIAFGFFAGWAAITRPVDAIELLGPFAIAMLWELRDVKLKRGLLMIGVTALPAMPFLSLQLAFDRGVTGHWFSTPLGEYYRQNFPGLSFGFRNRPEATESASPLPQVREYYRGYLRDDLRNQASRGFIHTWIAKRLMSAADVCLPFRWLLILLPLGVWGIARGDAAALAAGVLTFPLVMTFYPFYLDHYGLVLIPAFILLVLLGADVIRQRFPKSAVAWIVLFAGLAITNVWVNGPQNDPFMQGLYLVDIHQKLADLPHTPAVVLFHYDVGKSPVHEEPVFNIDSAWPDDEQIVRAHDLGAENHRIFEYYAGRQPQRYFYLYNRTTAELTPLGWAKDLAGGG